jgi:hypothetical protein
MEEEDALEQEVDDVIFRTLDLDAEYKEMVAKIIQDELEEEEEEEGSTTNQWGGSKSGKSGNKERDFANAYDDLTRHYFSGIHSFYDKVDFEWRFHMPQTVFNKIQEKIIGEEPFIQYTNPITQKLQIRPLVWLTVCLRHLAYGDATDREDENLQMSKKCLTTQSRNSTNLLLNTLASVT